jgi:hypothetical protein
MQRKAQEDQMAGGPGDDQTGGNGEAGPSAAQLKYAEHQVKLNIAQRKAEQDIRIKEQKAMQEIALKDAKAAKELDQ